MTKEDLENMDLHEWKEIDYFIVLRVINGWIYIFNPEESNFGPAIFIAEEKMKAQIKAFPKQHILRSRKYLNFIREKPCFLCDRPAEPHHERRYADGGTALKPSDTYAVPACRECHEKLQRYEIDALTVYIQIMKLLTEFLWGKI